MLKYTEEYRVRILVDTWIGEIDRDFDHILILEELETSLAVMMIKFCWSLDDVVHLKVSLTQGGAHGLNQTETNLLKNDNFGSS